ncbi:MAG: TRAP transporter large permease [Armatimonadota bacterium]|nr:TRAP transporter large permease [Armatimonadota bacterium]MDR7533747.1 TRAP transporter large permease [Armatimonadota bacterium]MDR7535046.1 TRAP transporter large permease [Armatimonadota bacterium]
MIALTLAFFGLLLLGLPVALALAGAGILYLLLHGTPLTVAPQRMFVAADDFTLMAIPLFILAGYLMNETGITRRLVRFAVLLLGRINGGLSYANIGVCMVFGGITGVAAAEVAAVGTVLIPAMEEDGHDREYATALTLAGSLMGPIIPPSVPLLIYGIQAEVSIGKLFLAGVVPGALIAVALAVLNFVLLRRTGFRSRLPQARRPRGVEFWRACGEAALALVMPLVVVGGIVAGVFTPTESAGIAVAYALFVGLMVFRTLHLRALPRIFVQAGITSGVVMVIVAASAVLNWVLAYGQIPTLVAQSLLRWTDDPHVFMLLVIVVLLIVGMPLDPVPALIVLTPVLLPAARSYGVDLVHFGTVMVFTLVIGLLTPPVGASLFVGSAVSGISLERLSVVVLPFVAVLLAVALVLAFIPGLSVWLPVALLGR